MITPAIKTPSLMIGIELKEILDNVKETIDVREGRKSSLLNEKSVTLQDLLNLGLITQDDINNKITG